MRARDFIFEAIGRRGFLKGIAAAAAALQSAPPPHPSPVSAWPAGPPSPAHGGVRAGAGPAAGERGGDFGP